VPAGHDISLRVETPVTFYVVSLTGCAAGRVATCCADEFKHAALSQSFRDAGILLFAQKA
jgi:hypothetical protein